jgi:hypothetical protein
MEDLAWENIKGERRGEDNDDANVREYKNTNIDIITPIVKIGIQILFFKKSLNLISYINLLLHSSIINSLSLTAKVHVEYLEKGVGFGI